MMKIPVESIWYKGGDKQVLRAKFSRKDDQGIYVSRVLLGVEWDKSYY